VKISAVILAAGAGTRLGGVAKALLCGKDGRTFLARIVATAREVGLADAIVVVGPPHCDAVAAHARELGAYVVENREPERGMASSVALGFGALDVCDAAWLWPVDHPAVAPTTLRALCAALGDHDAARPVCAGRRGHPPLVACSLFSRLAACADHEGGARGVLAAVDAIDVEVADPGCVCDVDSARDLEVV
jgi:molybdenum cofactor cytidylyltransferase